MKEKLTAAIIIIAVAALIVGAVYAVATLTVPTHGTITVTPVEDIDGNPTTLEWGSNIIANQIVIQQLTITNVGTAPTAPLHLANNLNAAIGTITWNQEGIVIPVSGSVIATCTLTVSTTPTIGSFTADLTFTG
jgi:hypothetical protein